jgi:ArsR family transcriptional regulator
MLQPKISRHLAQLRQCELLVDSREGQWVYYEINPALPTWAVDILAVTVEELGAEGKQQQDSDRLKVMAGRPEMKKCCS